MSAACGRMCRLAQQLLLSPAALAAPSGGATAQPGKEPEWDQLIRKQGFVQLSQDGKVRLVPATPLIGAEIHGMDLSTGPLNQEELDFLTRAFLRYKVVMVRSQGGWRLDPDQSSNFARQLSEHWGIVPKTPQQLMNNSNGLSVHPFIPWLKTHPHVLPLAWGIEGGKQKELKDKEEYGNFEPYAGARAAKAAKMGAAMQSYSNEEGMNSYGRQTGKGPQRAGWSAAGGGAEENDTVHNGANAFHADDGFFHHPPSAVVLTARQLPMVGGDTLFADMEAAYSGLPEQMKERVRNMTHNMSWEHIFQEWVKEAKRREQKGDPSFWEKVEQLRRDYPTSVHPLIRKHPVTGNLSIMANRGFTTPSQFINELPAPEARKLFTTLVRMGERPEYQVRMRWQNEGDTCVFDNRCVNHYAVADYGDVGPRSLHHIAMLGEPTMNPDGVVIG